MFNFLKPITMKKNSATAIIIAFAITAGAVLTTISKINNIRNVQAEICSFTMDGTDYVCKGKVLTCMKGVTTSGSKFKCYGKAEPKNENGGTPGLGGNTEN